MNEKRKLLRMVQMYDFALYETALYLDGHPNDKKALAYYKKTNALSKQARTAYESKYGPLTQPQTQNYESWQWVKGPWPWETED